MRALAASLVALATTFAWSAANAVDVRIEGYPFGCETPEGQLLKPKFGDVEGVFYTDLPAQRKPCLETIDRMIASCRANTNFASNTKNEEFAGCLPIFEEQAELCVTHFESERYNKCYAGDPDSTDTEAGKTKDQQSEESQPADSYTIEPVDRVMEVARQSNVRAGPSTDYEILGTLAPGVGVRVAGEVKDREWFRVDLREDDGSAFIYAPLLKEIEVGAPVEPFGPNWIIATNQPCQLWNAKPPSGEAVTWTGDCVDGKASGVGHGVWQGSYGEETYEGGMRAGKMHGQGSYTTAEGHRYEGEWRGRELHGRGTFTWADGSYYEGEWRHDQPHGSGVFVDIDGDRHEGTWRDGCYDGKDTWVVIQTTMEACGFE